MKNEYNDEPLESGYRNDDSEEGSQLQSAALEEAMGNKEEK